MLTTRPYLRTRRPSPTTVEFVVTTQPTLTLTARIALYTLYFVRSLIGLGIILLLLATWDVSPYSTDYLPTDQPPSATPTPPLAPPIFSEDFIWYSIHRVLHYTTAGRLALEAATAIAAAALGTRSLPPTTSSSDSPVPPTFASASPPLVPPSSLSVALAWLAPVPIYLLALYYLVLTRIHTEERLLVLRGLGIQTSSTATTVLGSAVTRFIPTDKIQDILINEAFRGFEVRHYLIVVVDGEEDIVVVFPKLLPGPKVVEKVWRGVRGCLYEGAGGKGNGSSSVKG